MASRLKRYQIEVRHDELGKYRLISGTDKRVVQQRANAQLHQWNLQYERAYERNLSAELARRSREHAAEQRRQQQEDRATARKLEEARVSENHAEAQRRTEAANTELKQIESILAHTLDVDDRIDWDSLKDNAAFPTPRPAEPAQFLEPSPSSKAFEYPPSFGERVLPWKRKRRQSRIDSSFSEAVKAWEQRRLDSERAKSAFERALAGWEGERARFFEEQQLAHQSIDDDRARYETLDADAIEDYCDLVLSRSEYPDKFPQDFDLQYQSDTRTLVVDYMLPPRGAIPRVESITYREKTGEFVESFLNDKTLREYYDSALFQISLRTIHELFEADVVDAIDFVVFNGWVEDIDKSVGQLVRKCVLSVAVNRTDFKQINLAKVDPKACFKRLRGVSAASLSDLAPVAPLAILDREDSRFVQARLVVGEINEGVNLAAMDWEDFEHLVRELFESEFSSNGAEVQVTRASRDGGVDAVVFDPDPIRGGKIVIQAKRYTATVSVSAVRDLFGTVTHEGATKGILVTTADYGPDAYEFIKGKPLTLLSGSNLLHLLAKHGTKARIDLAEARRLAAEM